MLLLCYRTLQEIPCLNDHLEGSLLASQSGSTKRLKRSACLDAENTPQELIQNWSPPHKHPRVAADKGKENDENVFVLARRPRKRRDSLGGCLVWFCRNQIICYVNAAMPIVIMWKVAIWYNHPLIRIAGTILVRLLPYCLSVLQN